MRAEVYRFAVEMERNLNAHDDRPGWKTEQPYYLLSRLIEEAGELAKSINENHAKEIIFKEAADVGNFAMMIADVIYGLGIEETMERSGFRSTREAG